MVRGSHNGYENPARVPDPEEDVEDLPESGFSQLAWFEGLAEDTRVVDHCCSDAEGISKMHARHRSESVNIIPLHPHALGIVVSNTIQETVLAGKQPWGHARVHDKYAEGDEVSERHRSADNGKSIERGRDVVVPSNETISGQHDVPIFKFIEPTYPTVPGM